MKLSIATLACTILTAVNAYPGVYLCTDSGFTGTCVHIDHNRPGTCAHLGGDLGGKVSSVGPDNNAGRCLMFTGGDCDGDNYYSIFPGDPDLSTLYGGKYNDRIYSFKCGV
ncbi:hypothetical protein BT63DRAFT_437799 [Microthyrium microscopicum]|uniref:Uncharacterized protein n=1 Tax=Microthyrium microscopicum TaxID=703497 RepID=A0A6A6UHW7_9PEZI|nr:hypothetical protein BT63DRAFT_437799 [Microthyrium microscopicum]